MDIDEVIENSKLLQSLINHVMSEEEVRELAEEVLERDDYQCTFDGKETDLLIKIKDKDNFNRLEDDITPDVLHTVCEEHKDKKYTEGDILSKDNLEPNLDNKEVDSDASGNNSSDEPKDEKTNKDNGTENSELDIDGESDDFNMFDDSDNNGSVSLSDELDVDNGESSEDSGVRFEDIGGLDDKINEVKKSIKYPIENKEKFDDVNIDPPTGVLLYGSPGTGKTMIAEALSNEISAKFITISGPQIISSRVGETEKKMREKFEIAENSAPSVIFIDEIDAIAPDREKTNRQYSKRMVHQLLTLLDGIKNNDDIFVIGATNKIESIDDALLRGGRFGKKIEVGTPNREEREDIINIYMDEVDSDVSTDYIAQNTTGFVGADIEELIRRALIESEGETIKRKHIDETIDKIKKTESEEIKSTFDHIGGYEDVKQELRKLIVNPYNISESGSRGRTPTGIIIDGESGTGKSMFAHAVANETDSSLYKIDTSDVLERDPRDKEGEIRRKIRKAKSRQPSIVLIENIDLITQDRSNSFRNKPLARLENTLSEITDEDRVVVIGTTNNIHRIDDSLMRNGLFSYNIRVDKPDSNDKIDIINKKAEKYGAKITDHAEILDRTEGFVGADFEEIFASAERRALNDNSETITQEDVIESIDQVDKSVQDDREYSDDTNVSFDDIGGLDDEIENVKTQIKEPLEYPDKYEGRLAEIPNGVLFTGSPGTGKTMLAKAIANEIDSSFYLINGPEVMNKYIGSSEEKIRNIFRKARNNSPSIVFIDEIDAIAGKRDDSESSTSERVVTQLLTEMDGLDEDNQLIVIGSTNRPDSLDNAIRRGGRFDMEIEFDIPDRNERKDILEIYLDEIEIHEDVDLENIVDKTNGYVGSDIRNMVKEADLLSIKDDLDVVHQRHFDEAISDIDPSSLREYSIETPDVSFDDIGGLDSEVEDVKKSILYPLDYSDLYEKMDMDSSTGVILYGPPGTGKTMIAKAIANESNANFISVKGPELYDKYFGESEKRIRKIFEKARDNSPSIIFIDELDAIAKERGSMSGNSKGMNDRIVAQLLTEIQGLEQSEEIMVLGTTNKIEEIDEALRRTGRFDKEVKIDEPDKKGRVEIFNIILEDVKTDNINVEKLAEITEGMTGSDINEVVSRAKQNRIDEIIMNNDDPEDIDEGELEINMDHFDKSVKSVKNFNDEKSSTLGRQQGFQ